MDHPATRPGYRHPGRRQGPLQMSLYDTQDLAEISHPDYPRERSSPAAPTLAAERARNAPNCRPPPTPTWPPSPPGGSRPPARTRKIGEAIGRTIVKRRWASTFAATSPTPPSLPPRPGRIDAEAASMASTYSARRYPPPNSTGRGGGKLQEPGPRRTRLPRIKTVDLDLRPIHHRLDERVPPTS